MNILYVIILSLALKKQFFIQPSHCLLLFITQNDFVWDAGLKISYNTWCFLMVTHQSTRLTHHNLTLGIYREQVILTWLGYKFSL